MDLFCVGCELISTQKPEHLPRWQELIAQARRRFGGRLIYSTNWDAYDKPGFWRLLDAVGVAGYWNLTLGASDPSAPTEGELAARWAQIRRRVLIFADAQNRPVLLTELGYPSLP